MKTVFITGGTRGIGRACVYAFAKAGYRVVFCYQKSEEEAKRIVCELSDFSEIIPLCCDLSEVNRVTLLAAQVLSLVGCPDVVIHNAGISSYGLIQDVNEEEYERVFGVNFKSVFFLTKELLPPMIANQKGRIITVSSIWGQTGASCEVVYSASKAALIGFSKALAKELAPSGIPVNVIAPGIVDTDMMARFSESEKSDMLEEIPCGSFCHPNDIAKTALFLAEEAPISLTDQVIAVNGGCYC
jgi:3-oxoacyl-[acyl-carrier protein] reductase